MNEDNENTIDSLSDAIQYFLQNASIQRDNADGRVLMYRGQAKKSYSLAPGIFRQGLLTRESIMIRELKRLAPAEFIDNSATLDQLIKMQHYGLPTRLLDITSNPLVSLFFACANEPEEDGEIITFYDYFTSPDSPEVNLYAKLSSYVGTKADDLERFSGSNDAFMDQENKIRRDVIKKIFDRKYIFISAPQNNERIRRQHGAFLLFGINVEQINPFTKEPFDIKNEILKGQSDGIPRSLIIPASAKKGILNDLDVIGINRSFLFPEFEHQATYIKQKFLISGDIGAEMTEEAQEK